MSYQPTWGAPRGVPRDALRGVPGGIGRGAHVAARLHVAARPLLLPAIDPPPGPKPAAVARPRGVARNILQANTHTWMEKIVLDLLHVYSDNIVVR